MMAYQDCPNCGCRVYNGNCVNCDEEIFIAEQYLMDGESVPESLAGIIEEKFWEKTQRGRWE